ncbi:cation/H(+) antiporter 20-like [Pistacia vera]|uniref:cation/H(+) antiporter 20-like n=1 Tax=Pistacia vera TaxID=55513 RepID=UPI0012638518|nr:cation/H(+) antiporter 20-like [Pistacia vera]
MESLNITTIRTSSDGVWQGDNPFNYAFPLLIIQTILVLFTSRFLAFLIKPLRQPKVIAEILGGILLGPSALGRNKEYLHLVFPSWSTPLLESVASIGLLFFLFLVGLELDLISIRQNGKSAFKIAVAGTTLPFLFGAGVSLFLKKAVYAEKNVGYGPFLLFIGVSLSITAFPVLARILADLKLLTTQVGQIAMAAAAFNDVAAWVLLALAVAIAGNESDHETQKSSLVSIWVLISGVAFVAFMFIAVRPIMNWVARQCSCEHDVVDEVYVCLTLAGVMLSGFLTDLIGIHAIFGAFVFVLTILKGCVFSVSLMTKIQDFVSGLLLPLYFASSGLKTDVAKIRGAEAWGLLVLVISTACAGKILGTFVMAMMCMIPVRESLALGVLMNTKGLVELIVLNIGREKKVLNDEMFAILVLMALVTTFMTTPTVMAIYKPLRRVTTQTRRQLERKSANGKKLEDEFRIMACIHGPENVPSLINVVELMRNTKISRLKLYVMHLVELTDRSSSIVMVQKARKNGVPFINRIGRGMSNDQIFAAFETYSQLGRAIVRHSTAISSLSSMNEDIFHVAEDKRVTMILLPFHKQWRGDGAEAMDSVLPGWREVNRMVLQNAPCSVAVLVDRGFNYESKMVGDSTASMPKRVCIAFVGGSDDRKSLELGGRMAEQTTFKLTLVRFIENDNGLSSNEINYEGEKDQDKAALEGFKRKLNESVEYQEKMMSNIKQELLTIGQSGVYDLVLVGKGRFPSNMEAKIADNQAENVDLGSIGNILASSRYCILSSVLVIQCQHNRPKSHNRKISASAIVKKQAIASTQSSEAQQDCKEVSANVALLIDEDDIVKSVDEEHAWETSVNLVKLIWESNPSLDFSFLLTEYHTEVERTRAEVAWLEFVYLNNSEFHKGSDGEVEIEEEKIVIKNVSSPTVEAAPKEKVNEEHPRVAKERVTSKVPTDTSKVAKDGSTLDTSAKDLPPT